MRSHESSPDELPAAGKHAQERIRECNSCKQSVLRREDQHCYETTIRSLSDVSDDFMIASSSEQYCCQVCLELRLESRCPNVDAQHNHEEIHKKQRQRHTQELKPKLQPRVLDEEGWQNDHCSEDHSSTNTQHHSGEAQQEKALDAKLRAEEEEWYQKCLRGLDSITDDDLVRFEYHEHFKLDEEEKRIRELYASFALAKSRGELGHADSTKLVEAAKLRWWNDAPQPAPTVQQLRDQVQEIEGAQYQKCLRALNDLTDNDLVRFEFSHEKDEDDNSNNASQMSINTSVDRGGKLRVGEEDMHDQKSKLPRALDAYDHNTYQDLVRFQEKDDENRIRALYSAFETGDTDAIRLVVAPKLKWWFDGPPCRHQFMMELLTKAVTPMDGALVPFRIRTVGDQIFVGGRRSSSSGSPSSSWIHIWTLERSLAPRAGQLVQLDEYWADSAAIPAGDHRSSPLSSSKDPLRSPTWASNPISRKSD